MTKKKKRDWGIHTKSRKGGGCGFHVCGTQGVCKECGHTVYETYHGGDYLLTCLCGSIETGINWREP